MFYQSLMAGWSRGFTLTMRAAAEAPAPTADDAARTDAARAAAARADLVAALRFPLAPGWILQRVRRPPVPEAPRRPLPRGCG